MVETPTPESGIEAGPTVLTWALFGLGNPGARYLRTRHNLGFLLVERLVHRLDAKACSGSPDVIHHRASLDGHTLDLLRPLTWMNRSGLAVQSFRDRHGLSTDQLLVAVDDVVLETGKLRLRTRGSHGGHNGLRSVEECLGTTEWARLRLGCGPAPEQEDLADFVLGEFAVDEERGVDELLDRAADAVCSWVLAGTELTMSRFNG